MIMKKITMLEITMSSSLKNPEVVEALKGGILIIVGASAPKGVAPEGGQVPEKVPACFRHVIFVDPVKDPKAAALAAKDPWVFALEEKAQDVAAPLLREGLPLVVLSYLGGWGGSPRGEWSGLLGVSEEDLTRYQREGKVALFGMGCGATPIRDWESLDKAITKENLEAIDKVMDMIPLAGGDAESFYRLTKESDPAYPEWATAERKEEVAKLLGVESLPEPADYPRIFIEKVRALLGREPSEEPDKDISNAKAEGIAKVARILRGIN